MEKFFLINPLLFSQDISQVDPTTQHGPISPTENQQQTRRNVNNDSREIIQSIKNLTYVKEFSVNLINDLQVAR